MAFQKYTLLPYRVNHWTAPEDLPSATEQWAPVNLHGEITPSIWQAPTDRLPSYPRKKLLSHPHKFLKLWRFRLVVVVWKQPTPVQERLSTFAKRSSNSHFLRDQPYAG